MESPHLPSSENTEQNNFFENHILPAFHTPSADWRCRLVTSSFSAIFINTAPAGLLIDRGLRLRYFATADLRWIDPPYKTLTSDQIIISYVKLFLNNEKKPQMGGLVRKPILGGGSIQRRPAVPHFGFNPPKNEVRKRRPRYRTSGLTQTRSAVAKTPVD